MQIENLPPNKPNFGMVVALAGVGLLVIFALAFLFLRREHVTPGRYTQHPVSQLLPDTNIAPGTVAPYFAG